MSSIQSLVDEYNKKYLALLEDEQPVSALKLAVAGRDLINALDDAGHAFDTIVEFSEEG